MSIYQDILVVRRYELMYAFGVDEAAVNSLETRLAVACGHVNAAHAQLVALVGEALRDGLWDQWGVRSPEQYIAWQTGCSPATARRMVAVARRRAELPETTAAFDRGEITLDQAAVIARRVPSYADATAADFAKVMTVTQLNRVTTPTWFEPPATVAAETHDNTSTGAPVAAEPQPTGVGERLAMYVDDDGMFQLHVTATAERGAVIEHAIREHRDARFQQGDTHVTDLDALVGLCDQAGDRVPQHRRSRHRVYVHVDTRPGVGVVGWVNAGATLPTSIVDQLCCDATVVPLWETNGLPVSVGRAQYIVPDRTRRLILDRDRTCRHPACGARVWLDIHHLVAYLKGGNTDTANLAAFCPKHHRALHRGEFSVTGDANQIHGLEFRDRRGNLIHGVAPPRPPNPDEPRPAPPNGTRYRHPIGERLDTHWITWPTPRAS